MDLLPAEVLVNIKFYEIENVCEAVRKGVRKRGLVSLLNDDEKFQKYIRKVIEHDMNKHSFKVQWDETAHSTGFYNIRLEFPLTLKGIVKCTLKELSVLRSVLRLDQYQNMTLRKLEIDDSLDNINLSFGVLFNN
jgi:hypothetical protein